mgnify:CR=1 FL=1
MAGVSGGSWKGSGGTRRYRPCSSTCRFPAPRPQFPWRNGWFYGLSQKALAAGQPDPCPKHTALLREVGAI